MIRAVLTVLLAGPAAAAWLRFSGPGFEVLTDAGEKTGREAAERFARIGAVFSRFEGTKPLPLPVRVLLFRTAAGFRPFQPSAIAEGVYQSGGERDYIALHAGTEEVYRVVYHEYVHLIQHRSMAKLPQWLEEGTAEYFSTLDARAGAALVGRPIETHVRTLLSEPWLDPEAFANVAKNSPVYDERRRAGTFYAQSWAMVHMLHSAPHYRPRLAAYLAMLDRGAPARAAFEQAFDTPWIRAVEDCKRYVTARIFPVTRVPGVAETVEVEATPISDLQASLARLDMLLAQGHDAGAERVVNEIRRDHRESPEALAALGLLALHRKNDAEAKTLLRRSMDAGSLDARVWFEYAMLVRDTGGPREEVRTLLRETVGRHPKHAESSFLLGLMEAQDGRTREAIPLFENAVSILPRQSSFWHALATAYRHMGRMDDALGAARRAVQAAENPHEAEMARQAVNLMAQPSSAPAPARRPDVITPPSWNAPKGESRVEGVLEHVDCMGDAARIRVRGPEGPLWLYVSKPGEILLKTASAVTFEFTCGPQRPRRVSMEFNPRRDPASKTAGDVVSIEFLDGASRQ